MLTIYQALPAVPDTDSETMVHHLGIRFRSGLISSIPYSDYI
ncbi:Protein of unknown function [Pyronema omphalodes CBS 100304]|uniref:Uncharacterized protein n=1 Tax=Pyronema omphalodes (strain CBS 100304) TaxID=1076935 RepID=U4LBY6_PYROM|nr:Protein of unknown function [Pyronema omphalodes CBS 100304]